MPGLNVGLELVEVGRGRAPDLAFEATFENPTEQEIRILLADVRVPSLVFQVESSSGNPVRLGPPPLPRRQASSEPVPSRGTQRVRYEGFLDRRLGPGRYRIRYHTERPDLGGERGDPLQSPWLDFEILKAIPALPSGGLHKLRWYEWVYDRIRRLCDVICWFKCRTIHKGGKEEPCAEKITLGCVDDCSGGASYAERTCTERVGSYEWRAALDLRIDEAKCAAQVAVRISWKKGSGASGDPQLPEIKDKIESAWSERFRLCPMSGCCVRKGYVILVEVTFVEDAPDDAHHDVVFQNTTDDMHLWSVAGNDTDHEFGHMIGQLDEYCTVDDTAFCAPYLGTNIMNATGKLPAAEHFGLVRALAEELLDETCRVVPVGAPCWQLWSP